MSEQEAPSIPSRLARSLVPGPSARALGAFYHQLASMLAAGLPIGRALDVAATRLGPSRIRRRLPDIARHVNDGGSLSDALALYPMLFNATEIAVIRAGEHSGRLDDALLAVASACERRSKLATRCRIAMIYPLLLLNLGFIAFPLIQWLQGGSFWRLALPPIVIFYGAVLLLFLVPRLIRQFPAGAFALDLLMHNIPYISGIREKTAFARFSRAFESTYSTGMSIPVSLQLAGEASGDELVRRSANAAAALVEQGMPFTAAIRRTGGFPAFFVESVETGEEAGELSSMMQRVAAQYEADADAALTGLFVVIPIVLYLAVLGYMGYRVFNMLYDLVVRPIQEMQQLP